MTNFKDDRSLASIAGSKSKRGKAKIGLNIREAYQQIIEDNLDNIQGWIDEIAQDSPKDAVSLLAKLSEYVVAKQRAVEHKDLMQIEKFSEIELDILINRILKNEEKESIAFKGTI